ncbi:hypothetical protein [Pseudomonas aeruginosa]|uniref:hypothetical protein n=1 Tax=Pseudomonas aeruginosa TaxID=287 RepID=UPI001430D0FE|nr:hypothetical protein [Pseudomonas aeruginosa]MDG4458826.1 hypothetical protein [Pseudomonas aeruginosa]NJC78600.1 hypothetical protein [Pseudomonas aeruginosa]HBP0500603.1 hypothetical protein [Pseudomonas aeruginosa]HBP0571945.1 hypothetical protein [Pseudomonas aeruginosa]
MTEQRTITIPACAQHGDIRRDLTQQPESERPELWAVHAQGPDELYAAFTREDADKHAAELNALPMPEGITVGAVVVSSPWPAAEHWQYLAEQERDHKNEIAVRLRQFERICEGLPQDAIDGGWTVQGIRAHSKQLEEQLKVAQAEVEALRAELQSQRERNTELIFKLGSATNGWGRCEKERDAAQARCAELKAELAMANDAAAKGDAARHQCAGMEMEIKELRGAAEHWEAESRALQKLLDAALAKLAELEKQEPVAAVSEETFSANGTSDIITRNLPIGMTLYAAPVAPAQHSVPQAWLDVQAERRRQITAEGWTPEHDDEHSHGQMARAAACYALAGSSAPNDGTAALLVSLAWPWDEQWWKPTTTRRDLVKACALGLAEIERLDRAAAPGKEVGHE